MELRQKSQNGLFLSLNGINGVFEPGLLKGWLVSTFALHREASTASFLPLLLGLLLGGANQFRAGFSPAVDQHPLVRQHRSISDLFLINLQVPF